METTREQLVSDAISFMQSIVSHYGEQAGLKMWDTISEACDSELKGDVFIKMLTGDYGSKLTVTGVRPDANAVSCIKAIRTLDTRGLGLKEAKDFFDACRDRNKSFILEVSASKRSQASRELRVVGFIV
jgi:hypothetical protein